MTNPYEGYTAIRSTLPDPTRVLGWWRWRWTFEAAEGELGRTPLPPPIGDVDPFPAVVTASWLGSKVVVDCYAREEPIPADALTYVSIIAAWLQHEHDGELISNGHLRAAIFSMSRLDDRTIAEFRRLP